MSKIYNRIFFYLVDKTNVDYVVNLEYEYGVEAVVEEAKKHGYVD